MKFHEKLKTQSRESVWQEYCGFLDLNIEDYMYIQNRLMDEQLRVWRSSGLGKSLLGGKEPRSIDEFRACFPLTSYSDYADILLAKRADLLPSDPIVWIETTWEGGLHPVKVAPYSRAMLDTYKHNILAVTMLASSRSRLDFDVDDGYRVLYGGAPLPYATGLLPSLLNEDLSLSWLPDTNAHSHLSFSQRIKKGFTMAFSGGLDYFFAIASVANYITENFSSAAGGSHSKLAVSPAIACRYLSAKLRHKRDGGSITPGEVFRLKGFVAAGTDANLYKDKLAAGWGVVPIEIAAGTESTCLAAETWEHSGMVFFPDACFYEFIPEGELQRELDDPSYVPRTCLMDGVCAGESYELVISVLHGGAFMRYRIGDIYRCSFAQASGSLPRFTYLDRVPGVIDIAGFTRITEATIREVLRISKLDIGDWIARKELGKNNTPFLHLYIEIPPSAHLTEAASRTLLTEHLAVYFKYFDSDYSDLKKLLNMEPLQVTILPCGTIGAYEARIGRKLRRINPSVLDISGLTGFKPAAESRPAAYGEVKSP